MTAITAMTGITRDEELFIYFFCFPASLAQEGKDYRDKGRGMIAGYDWDN